MISKVKYLLYVLTAVVMSSCNTDDVITASLPPSIILDSETGVYTVKQGREICIAPNYESVADAVYCWMLDGEVIGSAPSLVFVKEDVGQYFVTLSVTTEAGSDSEEIRIDVVEREIPTVSIAGPDHQTVSVGTGIDFTATVRETSLDHSLVWHVNGNAVSTEAAYRFMANECGTYSITASAENEDGAHSDTVEVVVLRPEDMPFEWNFAKEEYHTVVGRKLRIVPSTSSNLEEVTYKWIVDNEKEVAGSDSAFVFLATSEGMHTISASATYESDGSLVTLERTFRVQVYAAGKYYRAKNSTSSANWNKVYEYTPAPGQFINELKTGGFDGTQTTPEAAIAYAEARMSQVDKNGNPNPIWVSLGGFGGYIVVGFDHSIDNTGDYDLGILGNSFSGSSEPGIVWVMQDENGNGLPDDTWYELAGSETGKEETLQEYAVTYYRPSGIGMPVQWTDNKGNKGEIDYLKAYHRQEYYYPLWIEEDSYTLTGTCLKARNYDASGNGSYWVNVEYDWGYADNFSPIDRLSGDDNANADANANHFMISNAIDFECKPVNLGYIDFVKVQVGVNAKSGWLGEVSTEVFGFYDYNMKK